MAIFLKSVVFYLIHPLFWLGLLVATLISFRRISRERKAFKTAVQANKVEIREYLLGGLMPGVGLSLINLLIGVSVSLEWLLTYQLLTALVLLFGTRWVHPIFTFPISALLTAALFDFGAQPWDWLIVDSAHQSPPPGVSSSLLFLLLGVLIISWLTLLFKRKQKAVPAPQAIRAKRGRPGAHYPLRFFYHVPVLLLVPGQIDLPFSQWDFWPAFGGQEAGYQVILAPLLVGSLFKISSSTLDEGVKKWENFFQAEILLVLLALGLAYVRPDLLFYILGACLVVSLVLALGLQIRERQGQPLYMASPDAVKVIAIREGSPGERLSLAIGDDLIEINGDKVKTNHDFHRALASNRAYVTLKVRKNDGDVIMKEGALYEGEPYNLGLEVVSNDLSPFNIREINEEGNRTNE